MSQFYSERADKIEVGGPWAATALLLGGPCCTPHACPTTPPPTTAPRRLCQAFHVRYDKAHHLLYAQFAALCSIVWVLLQATLRALCNGSGPCAGLQQLTQLRTEIKELIKFAALNYLAVRRRSCLCLLTPCKSEPLGLGPWAVGPRRHGSTSRAAANAFGRLVLGQAEKGLGYLSLCSRQYPQSSYLTYVYDILLRISPRWSRRSRSATATCGSTSAPRPPPAPSPPSRSVRAPNAFYSNAPCDSSSRVFGCSNLPLVTPRRLYAPPS